MKKTLYEFLLEEGIIAEYQAQGCVEWAKQGELSEEQIAKFKKMRVS